MKNRPYYECPLCHAHLDPGEKCDCQDEKRKREAFFEENLKENPGTGQMAFCLGNENK